MASRKTVFEFCEGDTLPLLRFEYENVNILGWSFNLNIATNPVTTVAGVIVDPYCGTFHFNLSGVIPAVGTYEAEIETTDDGGEILTLKDMCITVRSQIA